MQKTKSFSVWEKVLIITFFTIGIGYSAESASQHVTWLCTTRENPWENKGEVPLAEWDDDTSRYISIDETATFQVIDGWGGAINEDGWVAMSVLPEEQRDRVLRSIFDTAQCAFNIGRISIGANDFSLSLYSCDDSPEDYTMSNFSLDKDKVNVIPFALAAKAINPDMLFWGSPHSPPAWMKDNNSMIDGSLKTDDATRKAYALYFRKWIEGMEEEGIHIYAIHVQNEPNITGNGYPACFMSGAEMGTLIKDYIGPELRDNGLATEIWVGTLHSASPGYTSFYPEYIPPTLGDPEANPYISGVGMQWGALLHAYQVAQNYPDMKMMQTEHQCGNFFWAAEYNAEKAPNDWPYGVFTFQRILFWLQTGTNSYCQWNIVLDEHGISNSITQPWPQNSMITVNKTTGEVIYTPQYYAVKHFSHFVKPGAKRIATTGNYAIGGSHLLSTNLGENVTDGDMMAFANPDGSIVLAARNSSPDPMPVSIKFGAKKFKPTIPANSLNTFFIADHVGVVRNKVVAPATPSVSVRVHAAGVVLSIPSAAGQTVTCRLINASGKTVKTVRQSAAGSEHVTINWNRTSERGIPAAPGVYVARITAGTTRYTTPFVLQ